MTALSILWLLIAAALTAFTVIVLTNLAAYPRLRLGPAAPPSVSVLLPARNEARVIGATVTSLLASSTAIRELIVLDDGSTDGTADLAYAAASGDPRLRVITGAALPAGWLGKNWACHQLSQAAQGDLLLFTDADVAWRPGAIEGLIALRARLGADLLSVWPTQATVSWAERLVIPLITFADWAYLPVLAVHHVTRPAWAAAAFSAAIGQCLLFTREAYGRSGGHAAVRASIIDDVDLARRAKALGLRLRLAEADGLVACRMYHNWPEVRDGFAKNILAGHGGLGPLMASSVFHIVVFLLPYLFGGLALIGWPAAGVGPGALSWLALAAWAIALRAITAWTAGQRIRDALWLAASVVLMSLIAGRALIWRFTGGPVWKGRAAPTKL
ncbi:MAG: glycosyltransferase [Anaerolineales bacterium]|nr:glycosyltransferase [Anaerolineales bacterium]